MIGLRKKKKTINFLKIGLFYLNRFFFVLIFMFMKLELNNIIEETIKQALRQAEKSVDTNPSEEQKRAGNYKKGHVNIHGFDITIENPKGSYRKGKDRNGKEWKIKMNNTYGYFKNSLAIDGDHCDVFIGDNLESKKIFGIDQFLDGKFDETKFMMGFDTESEAKKAYMSNYEKGWKGFKYIRETDLETFKKWLYRGKKQRIPFYDYISLTENKIPESINVENIVKNFLTEKNIINESKNVINIINRVVYESKIIINEFKNYDSIKSLLQDKNLTIKKVFSGGSGTDGKAYLLNNDRVLKYTTSESDAGLAQQLLGKKMKHYSNVYDVGELKDGYYVISEYIPNIDVDTNEVFIEKFEKKAIEYYNKTKKGSDLYDDFYYLSYLLDPNFTDSLDEDDNLDKTFMGITYQLKDAVKELIKNNIDLALDFNGGNFGFTNNGILKLFDNFGKGKYKRNLKEAFVNGKRDMRFYNNNNEEMDISDYLDDSGEYKIDTAINIINTKLKQPQARHAVMKYILKKLNKSNMSGQQKHDLRNTVMEDLTSKVTKLIIPTMFKDGEQQKVDADTHLEDLNENKKNRIKYILRLLNDFVSEHPDVILNTDLINKGFIALDPKIEFGLNISDETIQSFYYFVKSEYYQFFREETYKASNSGITVYLNLNENKEYITEENKRLKNQKFQIPTNLFQSLSNKFNKINSNKSFTNREGYKRLQNIVNSGGEIGYLWMNRLLNWWKYFDGDPDNDVEAWLNGGSEMRDWVNKTLDNAEKSIEMSKRTSKDSGIQNAFIQHHYKNNNKININPDAVSFGGIRDVDESLVYWHVDDASPEQDTFELGSEQPVANPIYKIVEEIIKNKNI
jgi:hypothetical protein